jgi:serine/threonine protein kinase
VTQNPQDPPSGSTRIVDGKYRIVRLLPGKGGLMRLLAENAGIGRTVELRMLSPRADEAAQQALEREARALGAAPHPNVQSILDSGSEEGRPYIVLEALEGPTLGELLAQQGTFELERAARLVLQLLDALRALHAGKVVVRALSPEHIVIMQKRDGETLKLRGLDRAEFLAEPPSELSVPFTPYVAPEVRRGEDGRDIRVDVYSAGAVFRHMLTGKTAGFVQVEQEHASRAILRAMSEDPDERFPTVDVCMQAVAICASEEERPRSQRLKMPSDPLMRDLHYLTLRRRTKHGTLDSDRSQAVVELPFVLIAIEAIYRRVGKETWAKIVDAVPDVERLLPSFGDNGTFERNGVPLDLFENVLEHADQLGGDDDLGLLAELASIMVDRGPHRLFPELPTTVTVDAIIDGLTYLWSRVVRGARVRIASREENAARVLLENPGGASLELTGLFAGILRGLMRTAAGPRGDVSVLGSAALGDVSDTLVLRW